MAGRGRAHEDFLVSDPVNRERDATKKTGPFEIRGATMVAFTNGMISQNSDYWDLATYIKQVGLNK
jgi:hypothetical protein